MFSKKTCCIVTGASQGLGACLTAKFIEKLTPDSVVIRLSRNVKKMKEAKFTNQSVRTVITEQYDQSDIRQEYFDTLLVDIFKRNKIEPSEFQQAIIVHNAGDLGDISKYTGDMSDAAVVKQCFDVNCTGAVLLNASFMKLFVDESRTKRFVINLSSLAAVQPFRSWSLYCSSKAARDMFFKTLASEYPHTRVLNYAPGPCETDMQRQCRTETADPEVLAFFQSAYQKGTILSCDMSISKLMMILEKDTYESGAHIDYYDDV